MLVLGQIAGKLVTIAILVEAVTEFVKLVIPRELAPQQKQLLSLGVGLILAGVMQVSIFTGSPVAIGVGTVIAGLIASRGSNYAHDFIGIFEKLGDLLKDKTK